MTLNSIEQNDKNFQQFQKICILNDMATDICYFVQTQGAENLMDALDMTCGAIPQGSYSQIVDQSAPLQFLQFYTHIAEHRFAFAVTKAIEFNSLFLPAIKNYCKQKGQELSTDKIKTLESAYEFINFFVLDGMPQEETKNILSIDSKKLVWEKLIDTHETFWKKTGGDIQIFYNLQACFIQGLLSQTTISFETTDNKIFNLILN